MILCVQLPVLPVKSVLAHKHNSNASDTWAVIVDSSRYYFNYRHFANALAMYTTCKQLGLPDERIVVMAAENIACNPRNPELPHIYTTSSQTKRTDIMGSCVQIDYKGTEVTAESFVRLLTGRTTRGTPASKQLRSGPQSNVLVYMTGHGGKEFFKFQDQSELSARDIANAIEQMHVSNRYKQLLLAVDTCQASSLAHHITSPDVSFIASSRVGENSYSFANDQSIGVSLIDRFTSHFTDFLLDSYTTDSLLDIVPHLTPHRLRSNVTLARTDALYGANDPRAVPIHQYFGAGLPRLQTTPKLHRRRRSSDG